MSELVRVREDLVRDRAVRYGLVSPASDLEPLDLPAVNRSLYSEYTYVSSYDHSDKLFDAETTDAIITLCAKEMEALGYSASRVAQLQ